MITTDAVTGATKRRYLISSPRPTDRGAITELPMHAGMGVEAVRDVPSASDLVARLWKECLDVR